MGVEGNLSHFRELAKLQRPQLFQVQGPSAGCQRRRFPLLLPARAQLSSGARPAPGAGVREITRFHYKVSEMEGKKKKKILPTLPHCPHPSRVLRVEEQQV